MPENPTPELDSTVEQKIEKNFRVWLGQLKNGANSSLNPSAEKCRTETGSADRTDLYSFYEELCAIRFEFRKNFQRSHESTSHFREVLDDFAQRLQQLDRQSQQQNAALEQELETRTKSKLFLPLIEIYDRISRLKENLANPVTSTPFWRRREQIEKLEQKIKQLSEGFAILERHFALLLEKEGVRRETCIGEKFDPTAMTAVEVACRPEVSDNQVIDEIAPGYTFNNSRLRMAKVIVNREQPQNINNAINLNP